MDAGTRPLNENRGQKRKAEGGDYIPRFRRGYVWGSSTDNISSPSALYTETAAPLPRPPEHLINDPEIQASLAKNSEHIKVETPFDVNKLESLLSDHPNPTFVESVLTGLREGFWPCDDGEWKIEVNEIIDNYPLSDEDAEALRKHRDKERAAERWSGEVDEMSPGMKISPMFVAWQKGKPRIITDHKGSGLNDGIAREDAKVRYDDMHDFGQAMHNAKDANPKRELITFKSDVQSAFLNLPAHPIWQLRQTVVVDGKLYIVRRLVFGNRASPKIWCAVSGLIAWIAIHKHGVEGLFVYMDDFYGWDFADNLVLYRGMHRPVRQVKLLQLWEAISCPFDNVKQLHGVPIKIIGFYVDIMKGTISLSPDSITDIVGKIDEFLHNSGSSRAPVLHEWQRLTGHLNWLLNVLPWGRPALQVLYDKMKDKHFGSSGVFLNKSVVYNLTWLRDTIPQSIGIRFVGEGLWADSEADFVMWTDASSKFGMSYIYDDGSTSVAHAYALRERQPTRKKVDIFFLELVAILSAIFHAATKFSRPPRRLLIYTDSLDAVAVFHSLRANEALHNNPLLAIAGIILRTGIDLRVRHIEGKKNIRADLISRLLFDDFKAQFPDHSISWFTPPKDLLAEEWRESF